MLVAGNCIAQCREMIYLTRQVHISLGKYSRRFERLYIALDEKISEETVGYLKKNHPFLHTYSGSAQELKSLLNSTNAPFSLNTSEETGTMRGLFSRSAGPGDDVIHPGK